MNNFLKILQFELINVLKSKWIIYYGLAFFFITEAIFRLGGSGSKAIVSLLNLSLILIPIISIIFGTIYVYNSREFIELLLTQPIKRSQVYIGLYLGLTFPLSISYLVGIMIPFLIHGIAEPIVLMSLLLSGIFNTFIFTGIAIVIALKFDDKSIGIGVALLFWFFFAIIYDGLVMMLIWQFSDYPIEIPLIVSSVLNPLDLGRVMVMLKFDLAALMGYTGAIFEKFFGETQGVIISLIMMIIWAVLPFLYGLKIFKSKNF